MSISRKRAWEQYAEDFVNIPRRSVRVTLRHTKSGVTLLHQGRVLTRCYNSKVGQYCAQFMAQALGLEVPPLGQSIDADVSTGVLFRAISIASLDLRNEATHPILQRMLEEAEFQRTSAGGATA
ncbi:MAG: hypothetical protein FJ320_09190 [SAR202 cluster bacterium]|nr:hypothetical protein [SAR202 cluster bacterium]